MFLIICKWLKNQLLLQESKGYLSYLKTFGLLFSSNRINKDIKKAENIIDSLKSIITKREIKEKYKDGFITALFTFLGLFISINILLNGFWFQKSNNILIYLHKHSRFDFFIAIFVGILFGFTWYILCKSKAYLYYEHYEKFELLRFIKYSKKENLNIIGKFVKTIPLILFIISMYGLQYYLIMK